MNGCQRCGGSGVFHWGAVINGVPSHSGRASVVGSIRLGVVNVFHGAPIAVCRMSGLDIKPASIQAERRLGNMEAKAIKDTFVVESKTEVRDESFIAIAIDSADPYGSFKRLPAGVEFEGKTYGKTGYDSDKNLAYCATNAPIARRKN